MMRIYLAASFPKQQEMCEIRTILHAHGHTVTSRWLDVSPDGITMEGVNVDPAKAWDDAEMDLADIDAADLFVIFTDADSSTGGYHVELGYALRSSKRIAIVGPLRNIFMAVPSAAVYPDWQRFIISVRVLAE